MTYELLKNCRITKISFEKVTPEQEERLPDVPVLCDYYSTTEGDLYWVDGNYGYGLGACGVLCEKCKGIFLKEQEGRG